MIYDESIYVVGASGHGKVVISTLESAGYRIRGILDDDSGKLGSQVLGYDVLGPTDFLLKRPTCRAIIAIGDNLTRASIATRFNHVRWVTAVHPRSYVHPSVKIGIGTVVFAGAIIQADAIIGNQVIINTAATVDHDCEIGSHVHIGPGTKLSGNVMVGEGAFLGIGSTVIPGIRIGEWTIVGAGSVVIDNLPSEVVAAGVPARRLRANSETPR